MLWEEQERKGMHLPPRDGASELDREGIELVAEVVRDEATGKPRKEWRYEYRGERLRRPYDSTLEDRINLERPIVEAEHATRHTGCVVEWCAPCEARVMGEELTGPDDPALTILRERTDARMRRHMWNGRPLPEVRTPQPEERYLTLSELRELDEGEPLITGVLPASGIGIFRGRHGTGKTFGAFDMALHVVTGALDWHGREMAFPDDECRVIYHMGEGANKAASRIDAWLAAHPEADPDEVDRNFMVYPGSVNLHSGGAAYERLHRMARELRPRLLALDTWATHTSGSDENSAGDTSVIYERLRALQRASGGVVLVLHHTGKSDKDARGSSAIEDNADFVLHAAEWSPGGMAKLDVTKLKDGEKGSVTLAVRKVTGSLVLASPGQQDAPAVAWSSSSNENRVLTALKVLRPTGPASESAILAVVNDSDHPAMNRGTAYRVLSRLVERGDVVQPKPSMRTFLLATEEGQP